jgi:hypothetical protein
MHNSSTPFQPDPRQIIYFFAAVAASLAAFWVGVSAANHLDGFWVLTRVFAVP